MSCHQSAVKALKEAGYRLTPQRITILEAVHHLGDHVTAEQILTYVERRYPIVDQSTVYRTLELLTELGIVQKLTVSGQPTEYEVEEEPHHHLICRECGSVTAVPAEHFDAVYTTLLQTYGFQADLDHLAITGHCASCRGTADDV